MDAWPDLSLLAFHVSWPGATQDDENHATAELMQRVTTRGRVMFTGCMIDGRQLARVCVLSFRTRAAQIDALLEDCEAELSALLVENGGAPAD
jgi:aromatic-L-amino-acid decarboxylase